jgi:hypothetical protein
MLILAVCICSHVSEIFDRWDNTFQTGADIESSIIIVALIAGAALGLAHVGALMLCAVSATFCIVPLFAAGLSSSPSPVISIGYSPPLQTLRI